MTLVNLACHRLPNGKESNLSLLSPSGNFQGSHPCSKSIPQLLEFEAVCSCQGSWNLNATKSPPRGAECGCGCTCRVLVFEQAVQQGTTVNHRRQKDPRSCHRRRSSSVIVKGGPGVGCSDRGRTGSVEERGPECSRQWDLSPF